MENYIVRIYSRDRNDPCKVTATLESVEAETRQPFYSIHALPGLLYSAVPAAHGTTANPPPLADNIQNTQSVKPVPPICRRTTKEQ